MSEPLVIGLDAGTGGIRGVVMDVGGRIVAEATGVMPTCVLSGNSAEHDADGLFQNACDVIRQLSQKLGDRAGMIKALATCGIGEAGVLLDQRGEPASPVLAWFDWRPKAVFDRIMARHGSSFFFDRSGLCPDPTFSAPKIAWLFDQGWGKDAAHWLHLPDYLGFRFCGEMATDLALASRTMLLDLERGSWSNDLIEALDLPETKQRSGLGLLPEIRPAGEPLGKIPSDLGSALGLPEQCVVAVGSYDHVSGLLAAGAAKPRVLLDSLGTAEGMSMILERPLLDRRIAEAGYNQGCFEVFGDAQRYYGFGGLPTAAAAIDWFHRCFAPDKRLYAMIAEAASASSRELVFLPQIRIGSPPHPAPECRGGFIGFDPSHDLASMYRAVIEGVALDGADILSGMVNLFGVPEPIRIVAVGGLAQNDVLMAIKSGLWRRPLEVVRSSFANAAGAAMLAARAVDEGSKEHDHGYCGLVGPKLETDAMVPPDQWDDAAAQTLKAKYARAKSMNVRWHGAQDPGVR